MFTFVSNNYDMEGNGFKFDSIEEARSFSIRMLEHVKFNMQNEMNKDKYKNYELSKVGILIPDCACNFDTSGIGLDFYI